MAVQPVSAGRLELYLSCVYDDGILTDIDIGFNSAQQ